MDRLLIDREITIRDQGEKLVTAVLTDDPMGGTRPPQACAWFDISRKALESLLSLTDDWDGYGGAAPKREIVESADGLLRSLVQVMPIIAPSVSPTRIGGVLLEWEKGLHALEIELVSRDAASFVYANERAGIQESGVVFRDEQPGEDSRRLLRRLAEHFRA